MVALESEPGATPSESKSVRAPRHGSSGIEKLDVPAEGRSDLAGRLSMLNLVKEKDQAVGSSMDGTSGASDSGRSRWGAVEEERKQDGPSLMEQMMAEATAAREAKSREHRREQLKDSKHTFGGGLKKGFFSCKATPAASSTVRKGKKKGRDEAGVESSAGRDGVSGEKEKDNMPAITGRKASSQGLEFDVSADDRNNGRDLLLPEVQEAMKRSAAGSVGGTNSSSSSSSSSGLQNWLTPELLDKISERPRLAAMLSDPRFARAMQLMSTSPKDALEMFGSSPEARESFSELMSLLSTHFTAMGKAADEKAAAEEAERRRVAEGPLAQEALRRTAEGVGVAASPATPEETASVESILKQPELRELLMDPGMQKVLQECGEPQVLARYMRHPEFGPKLQVMARAGLISFSSS